MKRLNLELLLKNRYKAIKQKFCIQNKSAKCKNANVKVQNARVKLKMGLKEPNPWNVNQKKITIFSLC